MQKPEYKGCVAMDAIKKSTETAVATHVSISSLPSRQSPLPPPPGFPTVDAIAKEKSEKKGKV